LFYRIVLHSHVAPGLDPAEVKRQFVRVTGLTQSVTEQLFGGMSTVIKRQVSQADAERIAATLRAIGVQATVELEPGGVPRRTPLGGPTVTPATPVPDPAVTKPSPVKRWSGRMRMYADVLIMIVLLGVLTWALVPVYERMHPTADPAKVAAKSPAARRAPPTADEAAVPPKSFKAANLDGPWRCTNQRTGVAEYWLYRNDGTLVFNGETNFLQGEKPLAGPDVPSGWQLKGDRVLWLYPGKNAGAARGNAVLELTITRFDFVDGKGDEVFCRRP
jgi:hypothetical protein